MKAKNLLLLLITPLLLSCGGSKVLTPIPLQQAQDNINKMYDNVRHMEEDIKEFSIEYNLHKEYFDGIRHTYQTMILEVDLYEYRIHLKDIKDDHNGSNHFIGDGDFWFWLDPADDFTYHIDMINKECEKVVHNEFRNSPDENYGLLLLKALIEVEDGKYENPKVTSKDRLKAFDEVIGNFLADLDHFKDLEFQSYSDGDDNLVFNIVHNYDQDKFPGKEFVEHYEFKGDLLDREEYHSVNSLFTYDSSIQYSLEPIDIIIPGPND